VILRETFQSEFFDRQPEPDLIMDNVENVNAFDEAGEVGALPAIYAYNAEKATATIKRANTVVDLGCGSGVFLSLMAEINPSIQFIGLDLSNPMLEKARDNLTRKGLENVQLKKQDFSDLSCFEDHSIDAVVSLQAFHHLPDFDHLEKVFAEVSRVLKPDGAVYFQDLIRLKHKSSVLHFAYYDKSTPEATKKDGEYSMYAAFRFDEYKELSKKYFGEKLDVFKTGGVGLYTILKTADRGFGDQERGRIKKYISTLSPETKKIYRDLKFFHWLGGLK